MVAGGVSGGGSGTASAGIGVLTGGDEILMRSLLSDRRGQELSADQAGLNYLNATKQSGKGMLETFERFAQQEYISASGQTQDVFVRSHPIATNRLAQLRDGVQKSPLLRREGPAAAATPGMTSCEPSCRGIWSGRRSLSINTLYRTKACRRATPGRSLRFFQSGLEASLPEVEALMRENPANPYFIECKADFLMRSGKAREAIAPLRQAAKITSDSPADRSPAGPSSDQR